MNNYKLLEVPHISRFDTWRFNTLELQTNYFNGLEGLIIDDCFPPFYSNYLKLDKSDLLTHTLSYNYCILNFDGKNYYYFITDMKYISEDLIGVNLIMDTIQTFMFDIDFDYSVLDRMSIKRRPEKNSYDINREYIRENLSQGEFINVSEAEYSHYKYILVTSRKELHETGNTPKGLIQNYVDMTNGIYRYLIFLPDTSISPYYSGRYYIEYDYNGTLINKDFSYSELRSLLLNISENADILDCIFIDNSEFLDDALGREDIITGGQYTILLTYNANTASVDFDNYGLKQFMPSFVVSKNDYSNGAGTLNLIINNTNLSNNDTNNSVGTLFNIKYIPALLDENYINVKFGEKMNYTSYPLYKSKDTRFITHQYYDFASYARIYDIVSYEHRNINLYNTRIICNTIENLERFTDAWLQYKSLNYATLKSGIKNNMLMDTAGTFLGGIQKGTMISSGNQFNEGSALAQKGVSYGASSSSGLSAGSRTMFNDPLITGSKAYLNIGKTLNDFLTLKGNLEHTPDTRCQGNQYSSDYLGQFTKVFYSVDMVSDIYDVAKKIEYFGYKVHKNLVGVNLLNDASVLPRYYYNIIKCSQLDIHLNFLIQDQDIINDIEQRFKDGLRLWNNSNNVHIIEDLIYDNVENDFLV